MNIRKALVHSYVNEALVMLLRNQSTRRLIFKQVERQLYRESIAHRPDECPSQAKLDRMDVIVGLLNGLDRIIGRKIVSKSAMKHILDSLLGNVMLNEDAARIARERGKSPPSFITISPTGKCNLRCANCYAADAALQGNQLSFEVFDRILREKRELWGSHWTVISGGEPFLWEDKGWDLLKLARRHPHDVIMAYTNGTIIDEDFAKRIADAGNVSPAISVEGFEAHTDKRRGAGTFKKILRAFEALRNNGIPFAISATATKKNWDVVTSDEFVDFFFDQQGALFGWIFQYMPMGRDQSLEMVVPPEARVEMSERMWRLVREHKIFLIDFWNSATVSQGCVAGARQGGYFHINWDGDIMPCVFMPYAAANINDLYASGGDLNDVLRLPFFQKIQQWQSEYGFQKKTEETGNWLCPCLIRDHYDDFSQLASSCGARPINSEAGEALGTDDYKAGMIDYGQEMARLTENNWSEDYLKRKESKRRQQQ